MAYKDRASAISEGIRINGKLMSVAAPVFQAGIAVEMECAASMAVDR